MNAAASLAMVDGGLDNEQLSAFVIGDETRAAVQRAIQSRWPTATVHDGGLPVALGMLSQEPSPQLLLVDFSGSEDPVGALRSLLSLCAPTTRVVALGTTNDVALYRDLTAVGAADYLVKPISSEALENALAGAAKAAEEPADDGARRRVIAVVGARGGVGATTIAVNTAWIMAHEMGKTVGLVDLDLQFGTVALSLDLEPSHGLREAFEKPDRIDELFIASAMAHESERLFVLSSEEPLDRAIDVHGAAFQTLIASLPDDFDCVVVDLPAHVIASQQGLLAHMNAVAVISDLSLAGMRDTTRIAHMVRESAPDAALTAIINKVGTAKDGELPKAEFLRGTDLPIKHFLASDPKLAISAANAGKPFPLIGKRSPLVRDLRAVAKTLAGEKADKPKESALFRFLKRS